MQVFIFYESHVKQCQICIKFSSSVFKVAAKITNNQWCLLIKEQKKKEEINNFCSLIFISFNLEFSVW